MFVIPARRRRRKSTAVRRVTINNRLGLPGRQVRGNHHALPPSAWRSVTRSRVGVSPRYNDHSPKPHRFDLIFLN